MKKTDIAVISFTYRGAELAEHIQEAMDAVWSCKLYTKCSDARQTGSAYLWSSRFLHGRENSLQQEMHFCLSVHAGLRSEVSHRM